MRSIPPIDPTRARQLVERFSGQPVLVVGDVMLDRFILGHVSRLSAEAPVPVVRFQSESVRLGGAANVAHNLAVLGARVSLVAIVGADRAAAELRRELAASGISADGLVEDRSRPTIEKVRIIAGRSQQVARLDYEVDDDVNESVEASMIDAVRRLSGNARALVVSDYLKGVVTKRLVQTLAASKSSHVPLLVDPKIPHIAWYQGATLITPNNAEAEAGTHRTIRTDVEALEAALEFRRRAQCESVLITRGEHGMWLSSAAAEGPIPAVAREVADVTGAGDTVVATLALALAAGATLPEAAVLANHAAGVVVGKFGTATLTPPELLATI